MATFYTVRGQTFGSICNWSKHQRIDNSGKPIYPLPTDRDAMEIRSFVDDSPQASNEVLREPPRTAANLGESPLDRDRDRDRDLFRSSADEQATGFDLEALYAAYPKKRGRGKGMPKLKRVVTSQAVYDQVALAIKNYAASVQGKDAQYTMYFSTFMTEAWKDWVSPEAETATRKTDDTRPPPELWQMDDWTPAPGGAR